MTSCPGKTVHRIFRFDVNGADEEPAVRKHYRSFKKGVCSWDSAKKPKRSVLKGTAPTTPINARSRRCKVRNRGGHLGLAFLNELAPGETCSPGRKCLVRSVTFLIANVLAGRHFCFQFFIGSSSSWIVAMRRRVSFFTGDCSYVQVPHRATGRRLEDGKQFWQVWVTTQAAPQSGTSNRSSCSGEEEAFASRI